MYNNICTIGETIFDNDLLTIRLNGMLYDYHMFITRLVDM